MLRGVRTDALEIWGRTESRIIGRQGSEILELRRSVRVGLAEGGYCQHLRVGPLTFDDIIVQGIEVHTLVTGFSGLVDIIKTSVLIVVIVRVAVNLGATGQPGELPAAG